MAVYKEEKTNTWRVLYRYTDWNGERKQTQKRGFKTKREAQSWEREQLNKLGGDLDMNFKSFVEHYSEDMQTRLKENTWETKKHIIDKKLIPYFGKLKMCNITAQKIITWQNELINYKDDKGKPYSPVYLKTIHNQLSAIFNHAVRYYNLKENPCQKAGSMGKKKNREILKQTKNSITDFNEFDKGLDNYLEDMQKEFLQQLDQSHLKTISMRELYNTVYQSKPPLIDGLLYPGTYIFAGAPKLGKSFLMAQLAYHISTGTPLWNFDVKKGTVLYLALEDDYHRLQERLYRMFGTESTDNLYFSVSAGQLGNGLDEQLSKFMAEHSDTRLIIVDTLQKVREVGGDNYSYANDYEIITRLKKFADSYGICLLLVHHTRNKDYSLLRKVFSHKQIDDLLEKARNIKGQKRDDTRSR